MIVWSMIWKTLFRDYNSLINLFHRIIWTLIIINFGPVIVKALPKDDPQKLSANLGDNVTLLCAFEFPDDIPVPYMIHWQKEGINVPIYIHYEGYAPHSGEGYAGRVSLWGLNQNQANLNLTNVNENDQGWYECKVYFLNLPKERNRNGTWVLLDVHAPPHFKVKPPEIAYVKVGDSLTLHCEAHGTPGPTVIWDKDGTPLHGSSTIHIDSKGLRMSNLTQSDIGEYKCIAKNREGSVNTSTKLVVAGPAKIIIPPKNITKLEGSPVEMLCEARALPSNISYRWFHNGIEISQVSRLYSRTTIKKNGSLIIFPSEADDTGKYTCDVYNGIGEPITASAYLSIEYPARIDRSRSPTVQYLPIGLTGVVRCYIKANPPLQFVTWNKDRRPYDPNIHPGVELLTNGSLLIHRANHVHQGTYRCTPYNLHGTSGTSSQMEVLVREPPIFTVKPSEFYIKPLNGEVRMACEGVGQPKPVITWRRSDGVKLPKDRTYLRSGNLTIKSLKKEDHGKYECVLENEIASLVIKTLLLVNNTTPHAPTNVSVNTSAFAASVTWIPAYDGGYQQFFSIRYRFSDEDESGWKTIRVQPPETTSAITIYNLQSDTEYDFQVFSTNHLGRGLASSIVRARTKSWTDSEGKPLPTDGSTHVPIVEPPLGTDNSVTPSIGTITTPVVISTSTQTSRPLGPKPGAPRNITIEKVAQGWVIKWLAPVNHTIPVAHYRIEYRDGDDNPWKMSEPVSKDTSHLIKELKSGNKYTFRVWAYSILGVGQNSALFEYKVTGYNDGMKGPRAVTAGIVGSVLFFVTAIILSVCTVKICNRRKQRKLEKAYMMVTCPVMDGVNGGHSHGGSPVPLKQRIKAHDDIFCSLGTPGSIIDIRKAEYQV